MSLFPCKNLLYAAILKAHINTSQGHYATGLALEKAGVVSSLDMTTEAISCKIAYLMGRGDLKTNEIADLMCVSMRGEVTHADALPPPPFSSAYQRAMRKGRHYY